MPVSKADSPKPAPKETPASTSARRASAWHWRSALAGGLISASLLGGGVLVWRQPDPPPIVIHPPPALDNSGPTQANETSILVPTPTPAAIMVFVSGAVAAPGLYALSPDARVADALGEAGGLTADANPDAVNQAATLRDGDQVHVPTLIEAPAEPPAGVSSVSASSDSTAPLNASRPINVNTASQAQLEQLPSIGPSRAADIIANRPYASIDELDRVPGIGVATLEELRPFVTVE